MNAQDPMRLWAEDPTPPDQLDLQTVELTHPDPEGHLPILRKDPARGGLVNVGSPKVSELRAWLPPVLGQLLADSYMGMNTMRAPRPGPGGRLQLRGKGMVHRLCSCYVDLDHDHKGLSFPKAVAGIADMVAADWLPWPSLLARSGNGMYVIWLLKPPAEPTRDNLQTHYQTNRRLAKILEHLGADSKCTDAARVFRLPGSYNTTTGPNQDQRRRVHYVCLLTADGKPVRYGLDDLYRRVNYPVIDGPEAPALRPTRHVEARATIQPRPRHLKGLVAGEPLPAGTLKPKGLGKFHDAPHKRAAYARIQDLVKIAEARGGIPQGYRTLYLRCYAVCLVAAYGLYARDLWQHVMRMNNRACRPPLSRKEIYHCCQKAYAYYMTDQGRPAHIRSDTIARDLGITDQEAERLNLTSIIPPGTRRDRRRRARARWAEQQEARARRRAALGKIASGRGRKPSYRQLAEMYGVSYETIRRDFRALGFRLTRYGDCVAIRSPS